MSTIIFGGNGFIGRRLVGLLQSQGEQVVCADIVGPASPAGDDGPRFLPCDLRRYDDVRSVMLEVRPTRAINLAYNLGNDHPPHKALQLNVIGTDHFFEASRLAEVEHVVFGSSLAVNGRQTYFGERRVTEEDLLLGSDYQYATHKVFNEFQAEDFRQKFGMRITSVRPANVTGHDKIFGSVDHVRCITGPALGEAVSFPHADAMRSPVHVDDVALAFAEVALADAPQHTVYNTGGNATSLGGLADLVRSLIPGADITFGSETGGKDASTNYLIDNTRLTKEFDFVPLNLEQCVAKIITDVRAEHGLSPVKVA